LNRNIERQKVCIFVSIEFNTTAIAGLSVTWVLTSDTNLRLSSSFTDLKPYEHMS